WDYRERAFVAGGFSGPNPSSISACPSRRAIPRSSGYLPRERTTSAMVTTYRFNTGTAQHTFCATCGIHPFYVPRSDPDKIDVNVRCLDGVDVDALRPHLFDGKNWEHAMAERVPWR